MKPSLQKYFEILRDNLSVRARHVLDANKIFHFSALLREIEKSGFTFMNLRNCGKKTAIELDSLVSKILNYQKELEESEVLSAEHTTYTIDVGGKFLRLTTDAPINKPITDFDLSVRTINCLKKIEAKTLGDLVSFNRSDLVKLRGFGKKVLQEIETVVLSYGLEFGMNILSYPQESGKTQDETPLISNIPNNRYLSNTDIDFSCAFKDKYGHFPMIFISYRTLSFLTEYETEVIRMTIEPSKPLTFEEIAIKFCLTRERIRQIYDKASKRIRTSDTIKQLFRYGDWGVYGISEDASFVFSSDLPTDHITEEHNFIIEYTKDNRNDDWKAPCITENSLYLILVIKGMIPLWIDPEKKELSTHYIATGQTAPLLFVDDKLNHFNFNKAIREVRRLQKVRKTESVFIPITSYFIDNDCYWSRNGKPEIVEKDKLKKLLIRVLQVFGDIHTEGEYIVFEYNKVDYGNLLYGLLKKAGTRLHRDELLQLLLNECLEQGMSCEFTDSSQLSTFLSKDSRIVAIGKSGCWGLKEWGDTMGSIREIAIKIVLESRKPIHIDELAKEVLLHRPDSNGKSVVSTIRQAVINKDLLIFYGDYVGHPKRKYSEGYILMPQTFDEWLQAYKTFVVENKRLPYCVANGFEGYLYRWHYRGSQFTNLSPDEILRIDELDTTLALYPQNATEYNFLQNCNLYKKFVDSNKRMLTKEDDVELFKWFYKTSRNYSDYDDNRNKYFSQLLQYLSSIIY